MMTPHHPANVAIVGPGAIGCACAAALARRGRARLLLCGRHDRSNAILVEQSGCEPFRLDLPVYGDPSIVDAPADVVILAVKAHQTLSTRQWLERLCANQTFVAILQNGVEHLERVTPLTGEARLLPVIVHGAAEQPAPGHIRVKTALRLVVPDSPEAKCFAELINSSDTIVEIASDFVTAKWEKLCLNAVAGIMAAVGRPASIFRREDIASLARRLARECIEVGRAEGATLDAEFADRLVAKFRSLPHDSGSSILSDRLAGRAMEWDARNGVIRRLGAKHGITTPVSDVLVPILAAASGET